MNRTDILERKNDILNWIKNNETKAYICRQLICKPETLENYLKKLDIQYIGNKGGKGKKIGKYVDALTYAKKQHVSAHKLKLKLIKEGIKEHKCEICNTREWMGKKVPIELDHIDGNHYNNRFDNLRIVCPNCHAQTDTNAGKGKKRLTKITN